MMLAVSFYSLSTESRFVSKVNGYTLSPPEHWLSKSIEICHEYLFKSLISSQVYAVYNSLHAEDALVIP